MNASVLEKYVDKVYAYAVRRTFSDDEASDLSQEILLTALKSLPNLRDDDKFEPWLWGVAENVTKSFSRKKGKQRAMFSYDIPEIPDKEPEEDFSAEYGVLREKIAYLSKIYREITVLYYYDGLSTKNIAERLKIPEGTVTWRLSEARRKIKKEFEDMEESALKPGKLRISIVGSGHYGNDIPFPSTYINDALSQNILLYCYDMPHTVEEIAKHTGVPAYFVEDRVENLVRRNAVTESTKGKYQTLFRIYTDEHDKYLADNTERLMLPIMKKTISVFKKIADETSKIGFYRAGYGDSDLFFIFASIAANYAMKNYFPNAAKNFEPNYDGYRWEYVGSTETSGAERQEICQNVSAFENNYYRHYWGYAGIKRAHAVYLFPDHIASATQIFKHGKSNDIEKTMFLIKNGIAENNGDGSFKLMLPYMKKDEFEKFKEIEKTNLGAIRDDVVEAAQKLNDGFIELFPKHIRKKMSDEPCATQSVLFTTAIEYAIKTGEIAPPSENFKCHIITEQ